MHGTHIRACERVYVGFNLGLWSEMENFSQELPPKALIKTDVKLAYEYLLNVSAKEGMKISSYSIFNVLLSA